MGKERHTNSIKIDCQDVFEFAPIPSMVLWIRANYR